MTTLATMKARIASEVRRSNITSQIASAITTAIEEYQKDRFTFTERRDVTFSTVAAQEFYGVSDSASIPLLRKLDYAKIYQGTTAYNLDPQDPSVMEELSDSATNQGLPDEYCYYNEQIRLYPVPDAVYTVRLAGVFALAAPSADDTTGNKWMTTAERLIRSRAKYELAVHVLLDPSLAEAMGEAVNDAYSSLRAMTNNATGSGTFAPWSL